MALFLASLSLLLKAKLHACPMILYENEFYFVGVKSRFSPSEIFVARNQSYFVNGQQMEKM